MTKAKTPRKGKRTTRAVEAKLIRLKDRTAGIMEIVPPISTVYPLDNQSVASRDKMRKICRYLYSYHWLIGGTIDLYAEFPITGLDCHAKEKEVEEYFQDFIRNAKIQKLISGAGKEYWRLGEAFIGGEWNEENKEWNSLFLVPPEVVSIERKDILESPIIYMTITEEVKRLVMYKDPPEKFRDLERFYPEIIEAIKSGQNKYPITPESNFQIWHWKHEANDYDDYGHPFISRAFRQILLEEKIYKALEAINDWWQSPILHGKIKTDPITQTPPTKEQMASLEQMITTMLEADNRVLISDDTVELQFINLDRPQAVLISQLDKLTERMLTSLGINRAIIQGEAVTYSGASIATDFLIQKFETYRQDVKDFLDTIAGKICEARGWDDKPDWIFGIMDFRDKNTIREFVIRLKQMGIPISSQTLLDFAYLDIDSEINKIKEEEKKINQVPEEQNIEKVELPEESKEVSPRSHERGKSV